MDPSEVHFRHPGNRANIDGSAFQAGPQGCKHAPGKWRAARRWRATAPSALVEQTSRRLPRPQWCLPRPPAPQIAEHGHAFPPGACEANM
eukprot:1068970-Prorocentrum_lima.AAC.1